MVEEKYSSLVSNSFPFFQENRNALHFAARCPDILKREKIFDILKRAGADPEAKDSVSNLILRERERERVRRKSVKKCCSNNVTRIFCSCLESMGNIFFQQWGIVICTLKQHELSVL